MNRILIIIALALVPASVLAAPLSSFSAGKAVFATSSFPGNVYAAGANVVMTAPVAGDLAAIGGSVVSAAPVARDGLLAGGSVSVRSKVAGDLRIGGGSVLVSESVGGDVLIFGIHAKITARPEGSLFIAALDTNISSGAGGPVSIYANDVYLSGMFEKDVKIMAGGRVTVAPETVIRGSLVYEAPEPADIPESVVVQGEIKYTSASYLPGANASRMLAIASIGIFLLVRILGALILAGIIAGLFPRPAEEMAERLLTSKPSRSLLLIALGFAVLVATPVLIVLLALTFVGIGLAALLFVAYLLLCLLALMYSGILLGSVLARRFSLREKVLWHDGVLGMLALSLIALVPFAGLPLALLLATFTTGALVSLFFRHSFPRDSEKTEMV